MNKKVKWVLAGTVAMLATASAHVDNVATRSEADALDGAFGGAGQRGLLDRFTFGSYGELHGRVGDGADNIDLHRLVAMLNFQVTEKLRLVTETEFEHALYHDEADGEEDLVIEIEQAYLEYALSDDLYLNAGIQLVPVGIINQVHEPTTFYGVERPNVEKYLIPTTWWESAVGIVKHYEGGLQVDLMVHSGLDMTSDGYIRSGRPKLDLNQYTDKQSLAVTGRAKYTGISGVELAGSLQWQDDVSSMVTGDQSSWLAEAHAIYRKGGFELRALATYWTIDGFANGAAKEQWGYYIEPSYKIELPGSMGDLGAFARFSQYEYFNKRLRKIDEYSVGVNYWPIDEVVLKVDYLVEDTGKSDSEVWNFGLGYFF